MNSNNSSRLSQKFKEKYYKELTQFKRCFSKISMMHLIQKKEMEKAIPFVDINSFYSKSELIPCEQILEKWNKGEILNNFLNDKKVEENKNLIDILSFSVIPSLFSFFIDEDSINSFAFFINELSNKPSQLYIQLSRSLFLSPFFICFVHKVFYKYTMDNQLMIYQLLGQKAIEKIRKNIMNSFKSNFQYFPEFMSVFIQKIESKTVVKNIFKHAFFEELIENHSLYFVTDYWQNEFESKNEEITNFLKDIFNDQMIDEMLSIIEEKDNCMNSFLNKEIATIFHQFISNNAVFDIIDLIAMEYIEKQSNNSEDIFDIIQNKNLERYSIFSCRFKDLPENDDQLLNVTFNEGLLINNFKRNFQKIEKNLNNLFNAFMTHKKDDDEEIEIKTLEVIKNTRNYREKFEKYIKSKESESKLIIGDQHCHLIYEFRFYKYFTFNSFVSQQLQLQKYDVLIYSFILKNSGSLIKNETKEMPKDVYKLFYYDQSKFEEYASLFLDVLDDNSTPLSKLIRISNISVDSLQKSSEVMNDFDMQVSLTILLIICKNHQRLISNVVFMNKIQIPDELQSTNNFIICAIKYLLQFMKENAFDIDVLLNENSINHESIPARLKWQEKFSRFIKFNK